MWRDSREIVQDKDGVSFSKDYKTIIRIPDLKGEYVIPDSVENIEDYAFSERNGLTSIVIPNTVRSIGNCAFKGCSGLTSLVIPDSVFKIGNGAFYDCSGLISIVIPLSIVNKHGRKSIFWDISFDANWERLSESYSGLIGQYIFSGCDNLTNVILSDNGVKCINQNAFSGCNRITSVTIPSTITTIEDEAFTNCYNLTSIVIPDSVTRIGNSAFKGCCNLSSIEISKHLEKIGEHAFEECKGLISIVIPDGVKCIGFHAFKDCSSLTSVIIPDSVTEFNAAFSGCHGLTSVKIPNSVTKINGTFKDCSGLTSVNIPDSVKVIGVDAFEGCSSLNSVVISNSVTKIDCSAFSGCSGLTSIVIPDSVNEIENGAFENCSSLTSIILPSNLKNIKDYAFRGSGLSTITIPDTVTTIYKEAFAECESLTSIIIPKGLKSIGSAAFSKCQKLSSVRWNAKSCSHREDLWEWDEYKTIRYHTGPFIECPNLSSFVFGDSVQVIPEQLCEGLNKLTTLTIPENVISIGDDAFKGCSGLTSIIWNARYYSRGELTVKDNKNKKTSFFRDLYYPSARPFFGDNFIINSFLFGPNVQEIPDGLCESLKELTEITIPDNVTKIGKVSFSKCTGLKKISIGQGVSEIGESAFRGCTSLESICVSVDNPIYDSRNDCNAIIETASNTLVAGCQNTIIPNDVAIIERDAFYECIGLKSINIPISVKSIGKSAFSGCSGLTSIKIPNTVSSIGANAFLACGIKQPIYNSSIFAYMPRSFQGAYSIPDGIRHIVSCAFSYCSKLKTVIIPDSVSSIGSEAFYACKNLTSINLPSMLTEIEEATFSECVELKSVTLKEGITIIKRMAFYNCEALESISIPDSVTTIERGAFDNCYKLSKVILPRVLPHIDKYAFTNTYGALQISDCFGVTYTDNFQTIVSCQKDFRGKYNIYEGVANIGDKYSQPFDDCEGLTSIFIPNSLKKINLGSFRGCCGLTSIIVGNENTLYDSRNNCNAIIETATNKLIVGCQSTLIPNSVSTIGEKAFWRCNSLTSITIPDGVKNIEDYAFNECNNLSTVTFYESIQRIGYLAFTNCENLKEISVPKGQKTRFLKIGLQKYADLIVERDNEEISTLTTVAKAYELGIGLPQNFTQAVLIYTQAAEKGGAEAAYKLAELYVRGEQLPYDRDKALAYYRQAAKSAFKDAASKVEEIQQQIKAEEARKAAALEAEKRRLLEEQKRKEEQLRREQEERQRKEQEEQKRKELEERWRLEELREQAYYIFFDTETAGLPKRYRGFDVENWPRLVQLAWILTDKEGNIVNQKVAIIRPDGFTIPSDAAAVHGITTEVALREGEPIKVVLDEFIQDLKDAHWLVGHNIDFDKHIIGAEFDRLGIVNGKLRLGPSTCTMRASTDYCAIPDPNGQYKYRWPKLQELYQKLFGYKFDSAHDAMADVTATKDCFFELMRRGIINTRY